MMIMRFEAGYEFQCVATRYKSDYMSDWPQGVELYVKLALEQKTVCQIGALK